MSEKLMPRGENEQTPEKEPGKKFTSFQIISVALLSLLVLVLAGFLAVYFLKKSDKAEVPKEENQNSVAAVEQRAGASQSLLGETQETTVSPSGQEESSDASSETKKPDLYVKSYDLDETPKIGDKFTAKMVIGNKGTVMAQNFVWEWWPTSSGRKCKEEIGSLAPGATKLVECDQTYDDADKYSTKVIVDSEDDVDEISENNNQSAKQIEIVEKADLYISSYSFNHDPTQGEEFTVSITIKNKGETDTDSFYWEWWPTVTGSRACREKIDGLEAGDSKTVKCDYTYGGWANYTTKAVADSEGDVPESNESNNSQTQNVIPIH